MMNKVKPQQLNLDYSIKNYKRTRVNYSSSSLYSHLKNSNINKFDGKDYLNSTLNII